MLQFRLVPSTGFLLARLNGLVSPAAWATVLHELEDAMESVPGDRLVLDLMGLAGYLGVPERQAVGTLMAAHFVRMKKVALFIQAEKITDVVKAEALRRGLNLRLFSNYDEAVGWVMSDQGQD
jgi:hypothetical protein